MIAAENEETQAAEAATPSHEDEVQALHEGSHDRAKEVAAAPPPPRAPRQKAKTKSRGKQRREAALTAEVAARAKLEKELQELKDRLTGQAEELRRQTASTSEATAKATALSAQVTALRGELEDLKTATGSISELRKELFEAIGQNTEPITQALAEREQEGRDLWRRMTELETAAAQIGEADREEVRQTAKEYPAPRAWN